VALRRVAEEEIMHVQSERPEDVAGQ